MVEASEENTSLDQIEERLSQLDLQMLIKLALEFDASPMQYFSLENLVQFNYPKSHYIDQLAFAFFENPHRLDFLDKFELDVANQIKQKQMQQQAKTRTSLPQSAEQAIRQLSLNGSKLEPEEQK